MHSGRQLLSLLLLVLLGVALLIALSTLPIFRQSLHLLQTLSAVLTLIVPTLGWWWIGRSDQPPASLPVRRPLALSDLLSIPLVTLALTPAINATLLWNQGMHLPAALAPVEAWMRQMEADAELLTQQFLSADSIDGLLANLFVIALLAAIGEELFFRGALWQILGRWIRHPHLRIWVIALLFSAIHLQFYGFIPRLLLGAYLGYLLCWTGSLWGPILAHFTNNAAGVLAAYFLDSVQQEHLETIGTGDTLYWALLGLLPLSAYAYSSLRRNSKSFPR